MGAGVNWGWGESRTGNSTKGGVLEGKDLLLPIPWDQLVCLKPLPGSFVLSLEAAYLGLASLPQSIPDVTSWSRPHIKRRECSVV